MSKKNLIEKDRKKLTVYENTHNILSSKKKYFYPNKIDKTIEIVIVPKLADITANQKNVGIVLDEKLILNILSKRYSNEHRGKKKFRFKKHSRRGRNRAF